MQKLFITTQIDFDLFCDYLTTLDIIAIDTEFMRSRTLYPQFALLQIGTKDKVAIIDPLEIEVWDAFKSILTNTKINKLFHAAGEDLILFWHSLNCSPTPYIDTQIIGSFLEDGASIGLAGALSKYLNINIDKSETRTDWLIRPLSDRQIDYAYDDVLYLIPLYEKLLTIISPEKLKYALEECKYLAYKITIPKDENTLYKNMPFVEKLNAKQLGLLQILAAWRYREANAKDLALNFVVHEKNLVAIAQYEPTQTFELHKLGLHPNEIRKHGETILNLVTRYINNTPSALPELVPALHANPNYKTHFAWIKTALEQACILNDVPLALFASRKQINQILNYYYKINSQTESFDKKIDIQQIDDQIDLLCSWRVELCEAQLREIGLIKN